MQEGVTRAERTIAVLSEAYLSSVYGQAEWQAAWKDDPPGEQRKLLTVRVTDCERSGLLGSVVGVDLFGHGEADTKAHLRRMIADALTGRAKPGQPPPFPPTQRALPKRAPFPGTMPAVWQVPARNPNFTGCTADLQTLADGFGGAAHHDAIAIKDNPKWARLTYMSGPDKFKSGIKDEWYNRKEFTGLCSKKGTRKAKGVDCDEYPFYSTAEGGPGASLKDASAQQNRIEGRRLQIMQEDVSCEMAKDASGALTYPGSQSKQFMVIPTVELQSEATATTPAVYSGLPTFHICGDERSISIGGGIGDNAV